MRTLLLTHYPLLSLLSLHDRVVYIHRSQTVSSFNSSRGILTSPKHDVVARLVKLDVFLCIHDSVNVIKQAAALPHTRKSVSSNVPVVSVK